MPVKPEGFSFCEKDEEKLRKKKNELKNKKKKKKGKRNNNGKSDEQLEIEKKLKEAQRKIKYMISNPPKIIPKSTKKFDAAVKLKRDSERKEAMKQFLYEDDVRKKEKEIANKWKGVLSKHLTDNTSELEKRRIESQREAMAAQRESALNWRRQKKEMMERVNNRPLLVEEGRIQMERERAKKKTLILVKESLQKAGITKFDDFFDQNELEQLKKMKAI